MEPIKAFVGHSFRREDAPVVEAVLAILKRVGSLHPNFSWVHAQEPEPTDVDEKVLRLFAGRNLFIGVCTAAELAVPADRVQRGLFRPSQLRGQASDFARKPSDWILQEIGIAIGRGMDIILLLEKGVRLPGAITGSLEYVSFDRAAPAECFDRLLGMIAALGPPNATTSGGPDVGQSTTAPSDRAEKQEPPEPPRPSVGEDLEMDIFGAIMRGEEDRISELEARFRASEAGRDDIKQRKWSANIEYWRIVFGRGGSTIELRRLAEGPPEIGSVWSDLALVYEKFDDWESAASAHEHAVRAGVEKGNVVAALGHAAVAYFKSGDPDAARRITRQIDELRNDPDSTEIEFLQFEVSWAEATANHQSFVAATERLLQLNPTNNQRRFDLAYKYADLHMNELALLHYRAIAAPARSAVAWNNLGVQRNTLKLPGRAVTAYRKSQELGETLAMSNLAEKLMNAGFLPEAKELLNLALQSKEPDKRVASILSRTEEVVGEEQKTEDDLIEGARKYSHFYQVAGSALGARLSAELASKWRGSQCELILLRADNEVTLSGAYEVPASALAPLVASPSGRVPPPVRYQVVYRGELRGCAVVGTVTRKREDAETPAQTILGTMGGQPTAVMLRISEDGRTIYVLEGPGNFGTRTYELIART